MRIDGFAILRRQSIRPAKPGNALNPCRIDTIHFYRLYVFHLPPIAGFRKFALSTGNAHTSACSQFPVACIIGEVEWFFIPANSVFAHAVGDIDRRSHIPAHAIADVDQNFSLVPERSTQFLDEVDIRLRVAADVAFAFLGKAEFG